jgi:hypothetical protein
MEEEGLYNDLVESFSLIPTEQELADAEARNLVQHEVRIGRRKQFNWDDCPVWQEDRPPDGREPPWRIPGQRGAGYFQIDDIERFLLHGDH